jgi:hypothetical protein
MKILWKTAAMAACLAAASAGVQAQDTTYRKDIRPLFDKQCAECHGGPDAPYFGEFREKEKQFVAKKQGMKMDSYADMIFFVGWPDTGALMRRLDDGKSAGGKPGNMYRYLGDTDEERQKNLAVFKAWVGEDAWNMKRWTARGNVPAITKEELDKIKVKY